MVFFPKIYYAVQFSENFSLYTFTWHKAAKNGYRVGEKGTPFSHYYHDTKIDISKKKDKIAKKRKYNRVKWNFHFFLHLNLLLPLYLFYPNKDEGWGNKGSNINIFKRKQKFKKIYGETWTRGKIYGKTIHTHTNTYTLIEQQERQKRYKNYSEKYEIMKKGR